MQDAGNALGASAPPAVAGTVDRVRAGESTLLFAAAIFLGAFLLFQVQPLIGKYVLPWFGGSAGVWAATLLFFQIFLLLGYAYAHAVATWLNARGQSALHLALLALALLTLPIIPSDALKPEGADNPVPRILGLLALTVGAPYLLLASNGPLLQSWFARTHPGRSPYRLYALSNVASLLALLSYPVIFERMLPLGGQAWLWSGTYLAFTLLCATIALSQFRAARGLPGFLARSSPASTAAASEATERGPSISPAKVLAWLLLPAIASAMLLATTNRLTQEVAPVPMLWVLPLSLYLVSFILTFDSDHWYDGRFYVPLTLVVLGVAVYSIVRPGSLRLMQEAAVLLASLYFVAMVCHGELVSLRPGSRHLTHFYLSIAAGGALGGAAVALGAPAFLDSYWEFHVALVLGGGVAVFALGRRAWEARTTLSRATMSVGAIASAVTVVLFAMFLSERASLESAGKLLLTRNFYSALQIQYVWAGDPVLEQVHMVHGQTLHGLQFTAPERRDWHTSYFGDRSGLGLALEKHPARAEGRPLRVGVIGLGTGSVAAYARGGDYFRYYEIDPQVEVLAREYFTYLDDASARGADLEVLLGDGRIVLEQQLERGEAQAFDILMVDAFNSDSIPVHLLTAEAFELYRAHLAEGGIVAVNVSNRYLDLAPVLRGLAEENGMQAHLVINDDEPERAVNRAEFVLVTANEAFARVPEVADAIVPWSPDARPPLLWTDDHSAVLPLLRF